eukprot:CAMPEP_0113466200 /NCGR_PEP_ID=MMETSP0014_2-20120614/14144_1 /TAXON_ID=2857 /ORGANISM="Nitzschia sp." /LENGTH=951 /DNA_ID=CAMNT_0000358405 /DNA_START=442 /DNA_END=3297 /DNA_ORIENTATION=+ /assembly_acc=CAM_ASM_000159
MEKNKSNNKSNNNNSSSNNKSNNDTPPYYYYDTVVIGGGLGGLTAGALLAKQENQNQQSVLLVEQHYVPGGCATTFKRHDYLLEVGLHEMDGLGNLDDPKHAIFDRLGVSDHVEFMKVPEFFCVPNIINSRNNGNGGNSTRVDDGDDDDDDDSTGHGQHHSSGTSKTTTGVCAASPAMAVMPHGNDEFLKMVARYYPEDLDGATRFVRLGGQLQNEFRKMPPKSAWVKWLLIYPFMPFLFPATTEVSRHTVGSWCDKYLTTNEFKLLFTANVLYWSDDPCNLSMMYFVMAQSSFISGGGYFIKGGSQRLSDCLASAITSKQSSSPSSSSDANGGGTKPRCGGRGTVLLGKTVKEILVDDESGRAIGVKIVDSYNTQSPELVVYCRSIICNACPQIIQRMLPDPYRSKMSSSIDDLKPSCSLITIYLGFDQEPKTLGVRHYSTFIGSSTVKTMKDVGPTNKGSCWYSKPIMFVDYSQLAANPELAPHGKSVGALCSVDYVSNWDDLSPQDYKKQKDRVMKIFIDRLVATYPNLDGHFEYSEAGTAKTIQRYTLNQAGSVYGYDQSLQQSGMNRLTTSAAVSTGIQNMYFGSAWSFPGGGFTGAILNGFFASRAVMTDVDTSAAAKKQDSGKGWTSFLHFPSFSSSLFSISPESLGKEVTTPPRSFRDLQFLQSRTVEDDRVVPLVSKRFVARDTIELTFRRPANLNKYQPGQYCVVKLNNPKYIELDLPLRPFSILSHPKPSQSFGGGGGGGHDDDVDDDDGVIKFTMRTASQTSYKRSCEEMEVGDTVTLYGPMGDFGRDIFFVKDSHDDHEDTGRGIVFLVAGIGITPVLPILQELFRMGSCQKKGWNRHVYLFYSNRYADQAAYHNDLQTMAVSNAAVRGGWDFQYVPVTTSTQPRISIDTLTATLLNKDLTQFDYYIVGATPFLQSMESILTRQGRVPASQINSDDFG